MCDNKTDELYVVTEIGTFGELDVEDPTIESVNRKKKTTNIEETIREAIQENFNNLT